MVNPFIATSKTFFKMPIDQTDDKVILTSSDGKNSVTVLLYGATIISWKLNGKEQLWLSENAKLDGSKAVRGGIPLVFPVFGPPPKELADKGFVQHGFARVSTWELLGATGDNEIQLGLGPENVSDEKMKAAWPFDFTLIYSVKLDGEKLHTKISIENTDSKEFEFNWLFHTYFRINEIENTTVKGLNGVVVTDKVSKSDYTEEQDNVAIKQEVDRVYSSAGSNVVIQDGNSPLFTVERQNLSDVVVWNPWTEKANGMSDFTPKDGFHKMLCIEAGSVSKFNKLAPNNKWEASQVIQSHKL